MRPSELLAFLEEKTDRYNRPDFIETDPIRVPHRFGRLQDIEIAGFFAATIAWGQRTSIIRNAERLMEKMGNEPYDFVMSARKKDLSRLDDFVHRTFNATDAVEFVKALRTIYRRHDSLEEAFIQGADNRQRLEAFHHLFTGSFSAARSGKHVSNPAKGSSAKRLNMFLRWMVRQDKRGVDFGLWKKIKPGELYCPLDVHSGNIARKLNILTRSQNDWKAAEELTATLRKFDPSDPVKYDFALFGLGVFEKF